VDELRQTLKSLMIRRLKKDVVKELPPKNRITHYHELSEGARELYKKVLEGIYIELDTWNPGAPGSEKKVASILVEIMRCKQVAALDKIDHTADLAVELHDSTEETNGHGKVIVFTQFVPIAHAIHRKLGNESVLITGELRPDHRMEVVDKFQNDPSVRFLVATWQTAGEGLNLQAAGYVLFNDLFWTPAHHEQCEDRAYGRLADPHPIDAYYIVAENTIEEWIEKLLAAKMAVIETVVEGMQVDRSQSVIKELMLKMKEGPRS
jgi:SNF2 family DNA or RNA helicase